MASDTLRIGDLYVGVRSHPASLASHVRETLADHMVDGMEAPANYSLRLEPAAPGRKGAARSYALYRSRCLLLRTRSRERVVRALVRCLSGYVEPQDRRVRIRQLAVVGPAGAIVLPPELHWRLEALERRLEANGMWLSDPPLVEIDTGTGELIVDAPALASDGTGHEFDEQHPSRRNGRYPILEWATLGREVDEMVSVSAALATVMPLVERDMSSPDVMEDLVRVLSQTRLTRIRRAAPALLERFIAGR